MRRSSSPAMLRWLTKRSRTPSPPPPTVVPTLFLLSLRSMMSLLRKGLRLLHLLLTLLLCLPLRLHWLELFLRSLLPAMIPPTGTMLPSTPRSALEPVMVLLRRIVGRVTPQLRLMTLFGPLVLVSLATITLLPLAWSPFRIASHAVQRLSSMLLSTVPTRILRM